MACRAEAYVVAVGYNGSLNGFESYKYRLLVVVI